MRNSTKLRKPYQFLHPLFYFGRYTYPRKVNALKNVVTVNFAQTRTKSSRTLGNKGLIIIFGIIAII